VSASKTDLLLVVLFGIAGYAFKKLDYPIAPLVLAMVLGDKAEDAFRQSMIMSKGSLAIFWSNPLVATLTVLGLLLSCWPAIAATWRRARGRGRPTDAIENRGTHGGEREKVA
jgi:TctA family transporter